jgi:ribonuclease T2
MDPSRYSTPEYSRKGLGSVLSTAYADPMKAAAQPRNDITARSFMLARSRSEDSTTSTSQAGNSRDTLYRMPIVPVPRVLVLALVAACPLFAGQMPGRPGEFDYYVLSLSWSPEFCYSHPASVECSQHDGFIVHGLWPQYRSGGGPEYCSHAPGPSAAHLDKAIMPDPGLIRHEWEAHGTCSGLSAGVYFDLVRKAFESIRIPPPLVSPHGQLRTSPGEIIRAFERANPGLPVSSIGLGCRGAYLQSVNICLTKDLRPTSCSLEHGCREPVVKITPVR